jgi:hypothetical protein
MLKTLGTHIRSNLVGYVALFVALGGTAYAANGGNFILGQSNSASSTTGLSAGVIGPALRVTNTSTGTAGSFNVAAGHAPFTVNSGTKVTNLNADKLDGLDSTSFVSNSTLRRVGPVTRTPPDGGSEVAPIATVGHFAFTGLCQRNNSGNDILSMQIYSDLDHSAFSSITQAEAGTTYGSGDMTPATNIYDIANISVPTGTPNVNPVSGSGVAPDGQQVTFNLYQAMNALNQPGQCIYGGTFVLK